MKVAFLASGPKVKVFAHRGLATEVPENTVAAFEAAIAAGADYIETDLWVSADGEAVICHDPNLDSYGISGVELAKTSWAELAEIDLGSGVKLVTLDGLLSHFPTTRFNIDLKVISALPSVLKVIEKHQAADRVLLASFSEATLAQIKLQAPHIARSAGPNTVILSRIYTLFGLKKALTKLLDGVAALQIPPNKSIINLSTKRFIRQVQAAGTEVHYWTINAPAQALKLLDKGADGIVSDRVDLIIPALLQAGLR